MALLDEHPSSELVLPAVVAAEASWLIGDRLGAVTEAAFVASVAERLGAVQIGTLNERDSRVVRPRHVEAFTLLP